MDRVPDGPVAPDPAEAVLLARERVWVADTACYYAHRRFQQSGSAADREAWEARRRASDEAVEALRACEAAALRAAERGPARPPEG
jgi:hypothetical protein